MLQAVVGLLQPTAAPVRLTVLAYVGGFEGNAFTNAEPGKILVALPLEISADERASLMAHEFTHAELKIKLGATWAQQAGDAFRYFMVDERRVVDGAYKLADFLNTLREI